jgi:hypothetical protein
LKPSDASTVVVIELFDSDPEHLRDRIDGNKRHMADQETVRVKSSNAGDADSVREAEKRISKLQQENARLLLLQSVYESVVSLKIAWQVGDVKLEIAQLPDARIRIPNTGQRGKQR